MHEDATLAISTPRRVPWNKGKLIGAKPPLRQKRPSNVQSCHR